jgi:glucose/mannose transport system substrate-binding protein
LLTVVACSPEPDQVRIEVASWWEPGGEGLPFEHLKREFERSHSEVIVDAPADPTADDLRKRVAAQILAGGPPSSFQANLGADLLRWSVVDTQSADGVEQPPRNLLSDLSAALASSRLFDVIPAQLRAGISIGSPPLAVAVPLNIHRLNVLYFNAVVLQQQYQRTQFLGIDELCAADSRGALLGKIALATKDKFSLTQLVFENLLPALTDGRFYAELFQGRAPTALDGSGDYSVEVRRALTCARSLANSALPSDTWAEAVENVRMGAALFTVTGDWANRPLQDELVSGTVVAVPFPGSEQTFVFTSDTFPLPLKARHQKETLELLQLMSDPSVQATFSREKGSLPARSDAAISGPLAALHQATRDAFNARETTVVLATSGLLPFYYPAADLYEKLQALVDPTRGDDTIDDALKQFRAAAPLLERWQARLLEGPGQE